MITCRISLFLPGIDLPPYPSNTHDAGYVGGYTAVLKRALQLPHDLKNIKGKYGIAKPERRGYDVLYRVLWPEEVKVGPKKNERRRSLSWLEGVLDVCERYMDARRPTAPPTPPLPQPLPPAQLRSLTTPPAVIDNVAAAQLLPTLRLTMTRPAQRWRQQLPTPSLIPSAPPTLPLLSFPSSSSPSSAPPASASAASFASVPLSHPPSTDGTSRLSPCRSTRKRVVKEEPKEEKEVNEADGTEESEPAADVEDDIIYISTDDEEDRSEDVEGIQRVVAGRRTQQLHAARQMHRQLSDEMTKLARRFEARNERLKAEPEAAEKELQCSDWC